MYVIALVDDMHSVKTVEYIGKGSYMYGDSMYLSLSYFKDAREYKSQKTAINAVERMIKSRKYYNLYLFNRYRVIDKDTKETVCERAY